MSETDTIFALASAQGRAGVSVIRVSGPRVDHLSTEIIGDVPVARKATLRKIVDPRSGETIDTGLVLRFDSGASFTGEPVLELQVHGSISVVDGLLDILGSFDQVRMAEPGEFTMRALTNGKMDLVEVEGLSDLIEAETQEQRRQANAILAGDLSGKVDMWRKKLLKINGLIEASIDFSDEELPEGLLSGLSRDVRSLVSVFEQELEGSHAREIVRSGFVVAIVGRPNVGKSTLLNALAGREVAIASEVAGTTRDIIEVRLNLGGYPVVLLDTAGIRESEDTVEAIGIERAKSRAAEADLRIVLTLEDEEVAGIDLELGPDDLVVRAKSDMARSGELANISPVTGEGLDELIDQISATLRKRVSPTSSLVRQRHREAISSAIKALRSAHELIGQDGYDIELVSEGVREAVSHLDQLVGRFDIEAVLGEIFSNFCIGK